MNSSKPAAFLGILTLLLVVTAIPAAHAQLEEPEVLTVDEPRTLFAEGLRNGLGVNLVANNFGIGLLGQYSRVITPYSELTFSTGITGIRDVSEQSFQDLFTGQRVIPNKYNRVLGFPFMLGIKHRLFARQIDDNFRFFVSTAAGPALSFIYPYFNDVDDNGFRNRLESPVDGQVGPVEPINDFFTGWSEGYTKWGLASEFKIGIDFGENFSSLTRVEFGYFFYYFDQGIQVMEPNRAIVNEEGEVVNTEPFHAPQKFFGTPQISLIFGSMW